MKVIGEKIRIARLIANKTITELADKINISKQAVSQFEHEEVVPKAETLFKISGILGFPVSFFTTPYYENLEQRNTFFRSLRSTSINAKNKYNEKTKLLLRIYDYFEQYLDMPELNIPELNINTDLNNIDYDTIANEVRESWELNERPIWNMVDLLEQHGVVMSVLKDESEKIDAFTFVDKKNNRNRFCVMLENEKNSMARRNFSIAHELGHIILHSCLDFNEEEVENITIEKDANCFAAAFLLPKNAFNKSLKFPRSLDHYIDLKSKWHVSIKAMLNRAKELNRITQEEYISLIKKYNYRLSKISNKDNRMEPLDDMIPLEKPELFEKALKTLFEEKIFKDYREFMQELTKLGCGVEEKILYDIMSLSDNFFDKYKTESIVLNLKERFLVSDN